MKTDQAIIKAVMNLSTMRYERSDANRAVGEFCGSILLPLITARSNSNEYKLAKRKLLERGRSAVEQHNTP